MWTQAMRSAAQAAGRLEEAPVPVRLKLASLWVSVMLLFVYVDVIGFYEPGTVEGILAGRVWQFDITQAWALGALGLMTVPSVMVFLSLVLPAVAARWTHLITASLYLLVSLANAVGESWAYLWLGSAVEAMLLVLIVRLAWTWPRSVAQPGRDLMPGAR